MRAFVAVATLGAILLPTTVQARPTSIRKSTQDRYIRAKLAAQHPGVDEWNLDRSPFRRGWTGTTKTAGHGALRVTGTINVSKTRSAPTGLDRVQLSGPTITDGYARRVVREALGISGRGYRISLEPYGNGISRVRVQRATDGRWKDGFVVTDKPSRLRGANRAVFHSGPFGPR